MGVKHSTSSNSSKGIPLDLRREQVDIAMKNDALISPLGSKKSPNSPKYCPVNNDST